MAASNATSGRSSDTVYALAADLIFASRIRATAESTGARVIVFPSADALREAAALDPPARVLIDLDLRVGDPVALVRELKDGSSAPGVEVIAFVSHVRQDRIDAARVAGADRVLARSAFVKLLPDLLAGRA